jgi:hypothetical protein
MHVHRFGLLALSGAALLGALIIPAWSDNLPTIPSPKGFIESSNLVPALKDQALLGHPKRTRVIGVYLLPDELASIMHGAPQHMTIFCRAYVNDEFGSPDEAKAFFRQLVVGAKKEQSNKFDLTDPDVGRIVQRYVDATKERQGQSVNMIGATFLGSILETEDIYAMSVIVSTSAQTDQGQVLIPLTGAVAWIRRGNQILELSDIAQFKESKSIETANGVILEWVEALPSTNIAK